MMKKLIAIALLCGILLSCVACSGNNTDPTANTEASTEATAAQDMANLSSPETLYGHINQLEPIDGVYKIWSSVGVENIANHPDGKFELLCNVDMEGATLKPIGSVDKPFTGEIKGANFFISNFTIAGGEDGAFGFVAVNKGTVRNLVLENVSFQIDPKAQNIGGLVGINEGTVSRSNITGSAIEIAEAPEGTNIGSVAGKNTGTLSTIVATVDINYTAAGAANVGGIVGVSEGGTMEYIDSNGSVDVTGTNKTAGLYAGTIKNVAVHKCAFVGASNKIDGALFTNFAGAEENVTYTDCLWRDNDKPVLTENQQKLRDKVEATMYAMGSVKWTLKEDLPFSCYCDWNSCYGNRGKLWTYYGLPYNHKVGSLARLQYWQEESGVMKDWVYENIDFDEYDAYMGSDCCGSLTQAWWSVSNSIKGAMTIEHFPCFKLGTYAIGNWDWEKKPSTTNVDPTAVYFEGVDLQVIYESYALLRKGDGINARAEVGPHVRMAADDAVVVRTQEGLIEPQYSYCLFNEQGGGGFRDTEAMTTSTWRLHYKYTFDNLAFDKYVPYTIEELMTGEMEPVECELQGRTDGYVGMFSGKVKANYRLEYVKLIVKDDEGNVVLDKTMFATPERFHDEGNNTGNQKSYVEEFYMSNFAVTLNEAPFEAGRTYSYTVTASLYTGDQIVVNDSSFQFAA